MVTQWQVHVTYPPTIDQTKMEQMQENAIGSLKARCPHIVENELEVHFSKPRPNPNETTTQQLSVECPYCEVEDVYH